MQIVTTTKDCGVKECGREMVEAQTNTRGILAVSAGALEVLLQYTRCFRSDRTLT